MYYSGYSMAEKRSIVGWLDEILNLKGILFEHKEETQHGMENGQGLYGAEMTHIDLFSGIGGKISLVAVHPL